MRSRTLVEALSADPLAALDLLVAAAPEVAAMAGCPQPRNHHAEGNVLAHSRLALTALLDLEPQVDLAAGHARPPPPQPPGRRCAAKRSCGCSTFQTLHVCALTARLRERADAADDAAEGSIVRAVCGRPADGCRFDRCVDHSAASRSF